MQNHKLILGVFASVKRGEALLSDSVFDKHSNYYY